MHFIYLLSFYMKKLNKNISVLIVLSLLSLPSLAMAQDWVINTANTGSTENIIKPIVTQEAQIKIEALIKSLEESMKYLKEHVTSDNLALIKTKAESLRDEYKIKLKDAWANEDMIKKLENRFNEFFNNLTSKTKPEANSEGRAEAKTDIKPEVNLELKKVMDELKTSLEESFKYLREHITDTNLDEIKAKADSLKEEYKNKLINAWAGDDMIKKLEERFDMFYKNQIENRKKWIDKTLKKPQNLESNKDLDSKVKHDTNKPSIQNKDLKQPSTNQKPVLLQNYKQQFAKKMESKLENITAEQINVIVLKIDTLIAKYNTWDLTQEKKDKYVAQLNAIKEVLNDKLDELQNGINLDQLFGN